MTYYLVTGALGFIGSNFVNYMASKYENDTFIILDKKDYCAHFDNVNPANNVEIVIGDIANVELVNYLLNKYKINIVVHFAAQTHVDNSFSNSVVFTHNNVVGTHCLLECCRVYHEEHNYLQKFIHVSTDEVYGEVNDGNIKKETSILNPSNPYAASKAAAEFMVKSYYYSYKLPIIITRGNNVYGINQYPEKVIPKFIYQLLDGKKLTIQGEGDNKRNFIHVDDVVSAFETIINKGIIGEIYNIAGDENSEISVRDLAILLLHIHDPTAHIIDHVKYVKDRKFNDCRYYICNQKLLALGWSQQHTDFRNELSKLFIWYEENRARYY